MNNQVCYGSIRFQFYRQREGEANELVPDSGTHARTPNQLVPQQDYDLICLLIARW